MSRRVRVLLVVGLVPVVLVGSLGVAALLGVVWLPAQGGWCLVSGRYDWNDNVSYSVMFQSVNFTYLWSTYRNVSIADLPYTAFFVVRFGDGSVENWSLGWGSYRVPGWFEATWGVRSVHQFPRAGVVTGNTPDFSRHWWRFTVASSG